MKFQTHDFDQCARAARIEVARCRLRMSLSRGREDLGQESFQDIALEGVSSIVTVFEMAVVEALLEVATSMTGGIPEPMKDISFKAARSDIERTWKTRSDFVHNWLGLDWAHAEWFSKWMGYVECRNAWAHGRGRLTPRQESAGVLTQLAVAGIAQDRGRVRLESSAPLEAAEVGDRLLISLEPALLRSRSVDVSVESRKQVGLG